MDQTIARASAPSPVVFRDGFGDRRRIADPASTDKLEVLCLRPELAAVPLFEPALRERVTRLAGFQHASFARVRTVCCLNDARHTLAVGSEATPGVRLSEMLATAERHHLAVDTDVALILLRQLVPAMAALHEQGRDVAHGALGPERMVIAPDGRLVLVDHVMGSALEQLKFSHDRYWKDLRVACRPSAGSPALDHRTDVMQIGVVALSLILGRLLRDDESPSTLGDLVASVWDGSSTRDMEGVPAGFRSWLARALQLNLRDAFLSVAEAQRELETVLARSKTVAASGALEAFLARYQECVDPAVPSVVPKATVLIPQPVDASIAQAPVQHVEAAGASRMETTQTTLPDASRGDAETELVEMSPVRSSRWSRGIIAAGVLLACAGAGVPAVRHYFSPAAAVPLEGVLSVTSNPAGARLVLDGVSKGVTPLTLTVKAGTHVFDLKGVGEPRTISVTVAPGAQVSQYVELSAGKVVSGSLHVRTEPGSAQVTVDGVSHGSSPVTVDDLSPGAHLVLLEGPTGSTKQTVMVEAGATASLVAQLTTAPTVNLPGWISVSAPSDVQLFENGRLLGSSQTDRLMVPAGAHQIEIVNQALGFRTTRTVQVGSDKVSSIKLEFPNGTIALNATPWADVWIDGAKVGQTPIGNLPVTIGSHEIIFRHPDLGEQRHVATVSLTAPARLSVDMRQK